MKRVEVIVTVLLAVFNTKHGVGAPSYQLDVVSGTKVFVRGITMASVEEISLDIFLAQANYPQHAGGAWLDWSTSTGALSYVSAGRAFQDGSEGLTGPWTSGAGALVEEPAGPGTLLMQTVNLGGAQPDVDGDIIVGRITFRYNGVGAARIDILTIPQVATWTPIKDDEVLPGYFMINPSSLSSSTTSSPLCSTTISASSTSSLPLTTTTVDEGDTTTTTTVIMFDSSSSVLTTTTTTYLICPIEQIYGRSSKEAQVLRFMKDAILSRSFEGREIIKLYYDWSSVIVEMMEKDEVFKQEIKEMIDEVLKSHFVVYPE